jgi:hypothetical protein
VKLTIILFMENTFKRKQDNLILFLLFLISFDKIILLEIFMKNKILDVTFYLLQSKNLCLFCYFKSNILAFDLE